MDAKYRGRYKAKTAEYNKKWNASHTECRREYNAEYNRVHKEERKVKDKARRSTPEYKMKLKAYHANRAAKELGITDLLTYEDICTLASDGPMLCVYCSTNPGDTWQIDHVVSMLHGGTNMIENLAICCKPCNSGKADNSMLYFLAKKGN